MEQVGEEVKETEEQLWTNSDAEEEHEDGVSADRPARIV